MRAGRLFRNRAALVGIIVLGIIAAAAIFGPFFLAYPYDYIDYSVVSCAPDWWPDPGVLCNAGGTHWFGTDSVGRDLLVRTLYGARISLAVGLIATLVSLVIGVAYGATAGYIGGRIDELMMRFVDVLYSIPYIFLVIILMVIFNRNFFLLFVAIGAVEWLTMARIVPRPDPVDQAEGVRRGGARRRRRQFRHHRAPHHPQRVRAGDRLCHADRAGLDPGRELPVLPGPGHPGAA
ncbi:MAG: hypothetical protein WDM81_03105 [Rhizomicrobium sp.]